MRGGSDAESPGFTSLIEETRSDMDAINGKLRAIRKQRDAIRVHDAGPSLLSDVDRLNADVAVSRSVARRATSSHEGTSARTGSGLSNLSGAAGAGAAASAKPVGGLAMRLNDALSIETRESRARRRPMLSSSLRGKQGGSSLMEQLNMLSDGASTRSSLSCESRTSSISRSSSMHARGVLDELHAAQGRPGRGRARADDVDIASPRSTSRTARAGMAGVSTARAASMRTRHPPHMRAGMRDGSVRTASMRAIAGPGQSAAAKRTLPQAWLQAGKASSPTLGKREPGALASVPAIQRLQHQMYGESGTIGGSDGFSAAGSKASFAGTASVGSRRSSFSTTSSMLGVPGASPAAGLRQRKLGAMLPRTSKALDSVDAVLYTSVDHDPLEVDMTSIVANVLSAIMFAHPQAHADVPDLLMTARGTALARQAFWYCFCSFFQPGSGAVRGKLLEKMARAYVDQTVMRHHAEPVLEAFPFALAEVVYQAFPHVFPASLFCFGEFFRDTTHVLIAQLFIGLDVNRDFFLLMRDRVMAVNGSVLKHLFAQVREHALLHAPSARRRSTVSANGISSSSASLATATSRTSQQQIDLIPGLREDLGADLDVEGLLFSEAVDAETKPSLLPRRQDFHLYHMSPITHAFLQRSGGALLRKTRMQRVVPSGPYHVVTRDTDGAGELAWHRDSERDKQRRLQRATMPGEAVQDKAVARKAREQQQSAMHAKYDALKAQVKRDLGRLHRSLRHEKRRLRAREERLRMQSETGLNDFIMDIIEQQSMTRSVTGRNKLFNYVKLDASRGGGTIGQSRKDQNREAAMFNASRNKRAGPVMVWSTMEIVNRS